MENAGGRPGSHLGPGGRALWDGDRDAREKLFGGGIEGLGYWLHLRTVREMGCQDDPQVVACATMRLDGRCTPGGTPGGWATSPLASTSTFRAFTQSPMQEVLCLHMSPVLHRQTLCVLGVPGSSDLQPDQ